MIFYGRLSFSFEFAAFAVFYAFFTLYPYLFGVFSLYIF